MFTNTRESLQGDAINWETSNETDAKDMVLRSRQPVNLAWCATLACSCCTRSQPRGGSLLDKLTHAPRSFVPSRRSARSTTTEFQRVFHAPPSGKSKWTRCSSNWTINSGVRKKPTAANRLGVDLLLLRASSLSLPAHATVHASLQTFCRCSWPGPLERPLLLPSGPPLPLRGCV